MEFPPNSKKVVGEERPQKEVTKVVSGEVVSRKKPLGERVKNVLFNGEFKRASHYVVREVLLPAIKGMIVDATSRGVESVIYGESVANRRRQSVDYSGRTRVSYNNIPIGGRDPRSVRMLPDQSPRYVDNRSSDIRDIILGARSDAELVLEQLRNLIDQYDTASVADLYDLVGLPSVHTDNKWGWSALGFAGVRQIREGYLLDLPAPQPII